MARKTDSETLIKAMDLQKREPSETKFRGRVCRLLVA